MNDLKIIMFDYYLLRAKGTIYHVPKGHRKRIWG